MTTFLSLITSPMALRSPVPEEQVSKVSASASTLFSASSGLIALHIAEDALLRRVAPAGVAPHLGFARKPFTVLLKILTRSSTSSLPKVLPRAGTMWICGSSICTTGQPASSLSSALSASLIA